MSSRNPRSSTMTIAMKMTDQELLARLLQIHELARPSALATDRRETRIKELLEANNREVERRRAAVAALRHLRERLRAAWVMDIDGKSVWLPEFIDAAIEAAEAQPAAPASGDG